MKRLVPLLLIGLAAVLTACPQSGTVEPTFTIRLYPAVLSLRVTETGVVTILVNRSGEFSAPVTVTLSGDTTGLESDPVTISGAEGTLHIHVTDAAPVGTAHLKVKAVAGSITRSEALTLHIAKAVANVNEVTVKENGGSGQVRQGFGQVELVVAGSNLERASGFTLGGLEIEVGERTPTQMTLTVAVPHGAPPGVKDLVVNAEGGTTTYEGALEVTAITAGPAGSDSAGSGTPESPYRTLTHALSFSAAGDTVKLLEGTYGQVAGETWPPASAGVYQPNVPAGVGVEGQSAVGVLLSGPGDGSAVGLMFASDGAATNLRVRGFSIGVVAQDGEVTITGVLADANDTGLSATGGTTIVIASEFTNSTGSGLVASANAVLQLRESSAYLNGGAGVELSSGTPTLRAVGLEAHHNSSGVRSGEGASVTLERALLHDNLEFGLAVYQGSSVSVSDSDFYANDQGGLWMGGKSLKLRGSSSRDNGDFGVYVAGEPELIDLGTFAEPGNNDLDGNGPNGTSGHLMDARSARPTVENPIIFTVSATRIGGVLPEPDVYVGPYFNNDVGFSILEANRVVQIY